MHLYKGNLLAVRRPHWRIVGAWMVRQPSHVAPVHAHNIDFVAVILVGNEGDLLAIGRPRRINVGGMVVRHAPLPAAVHLHAVDFTVTVAVGDERDELAVGRPRRAAVVAHMIRNVDSDMPAHLLDVDFGVLITMGGECHRGIGDNATHQERNHNERGKQQQRGRAVTHQSWLNRQCVYGIHTR